MSVPIVQVDAFTDAPFRGNPATVCVLPEPRDEGWMQAVAREMNLSETAFLVREGEAFRLRWFTPTVEVDLCGHATLASAHVLWEARLLEPEEEARFLTRSGLLTARREGEWIVLDFPAQPEEETTASAELIEGLGTTPRYVGRSRFDLLVELESEEEVRSLEPNIAILARVPARGVVVTARAGAGVGEGVGAGGKGDGEWGDGGGGSGEGGEEWGGGGGGRGGGYDFVSRFFGPRVGVDEDPVTGSAHCVLGPFWRKQLGRAELVGYQASARGGYVRVAVDGDRVRLGGRAVTVLRGELLG